jgi:hypothetical protein
MKRRGEEKLERRDASSRPSGEAAKRRVGLGEANKMPIEYIYTWAAWTWIYVSTKRREVRRRRGGGGEVEEDEGEERPTKRGEGLMEEKVDTAGAETGTNARQNQAKMLVSWLIVIRNITARLELDCGSGEASDRFQFQISKRFCDCTELD